MNLLSKEARVSAKFFILSTFLSFLAIAVGIVAFIFVDEGWRDDSSMAVWFMLAISALYFVMFFIYRGNLGIDWSVARYFSSYGKGAIEDEAMELVRRYSPFMLIGGAVFLAAGIVGLTTG